MSSNGSSTALSLASAPNQLFAIDPRRAALAADPFEPQNYAELWKFAETVCVTPFCPKEFRDKPGDAFVAMLYGKSLGLSALQALQGIGVINGKPSTYGETFWAVITSHPEFVDAEEETNDERAVCLLTRRNRKPYRGEFTRTDAQTAKLWGKDGPWTNYPKGQMLWRARHRAATALFADALKGILPREVALDYIEGEVVKPTPPAPLPAASLTAAPTEAAKGDLPKPQADPNITEEQAKAWNKAWEPVFERHGLSGKEHMKARADAKRDELARINVQRTGEMKLSQYEASLRHLAEWAPPQPASAPQELPTPTTQANVPAPVQSEPEEPAADPNLPEKTVRGWMNALGMSMFEQSAKIGRLSDGGVVDWGQLAMELMQAHGDALTQKGLL